MGRNHTPAVVEDMSIRLEDVVSAAGINFQTFSTFRTEFRLIKDAHVLLRQRQRSNTLPADYAELLQFLDLMLGERILEPAGSVAGADGSEVEGAVVRCQITTLMSDVRTLLRAYNRLV
jgi:hypothetical protein